MASEQDSVWKEVLDAYFKEFLAFFFPETHQDVDWRRAYEFLDKELEKVVQDSELGKRLVDKLVKVYLKDGAETWLLIHIELQSYADPGFEERMYVYNYRIFDRYPSEVISTAVLTDTTQSYRPQAYLRRRWGFRHLFEFPTVKLNRL